MDSTHTKASLLKLEHAIIFDMDGVIVDSEPYHNAATLKVMKQIGFDESHWVRYAEYIGQSDHMLWSDFVNRHTLDLSLNYLLKMKSDCVIEMIRREKPIFDGVIALLEKLSAVGKLGLASGSERAVVEEVLSLQDMRRFFSATVTASDVKYGKPSPHIFLRTAELLAVPPESCWVIEDSKPGITAGLAAGMKVVAITNSHPADELRQATYVVSSYFEIERLLLSC